ncbi:aldo/keto reductase [Streptomyces violascens]|uniref:aldo/keto reductase n=1 Tax=Streptomyces violascens TaxID=67381 RepID=UPI003682CC07
MGAPKIAADLAGVARYRGDSASPASEGSGRKSAAIVDTITHLAAAKSATPAQIALAWLMARGSDVIPIPGSSRRPHLRDNLAALDLHLTATDLRDIDANVPDTGA